MESLTSFSVALASAISIQDGMVLVQPICWEKGVGLKVKTQSTKCQMRDQGYNLRFSSKECEIRKADLGRLVEKESRTTSNVYILDEVKG